MTSFRTRIRRAAGRSGGVVLACDYIASADPESRAVGDVERLHGYVCAIKVNFHLLLPLGADGISRINEAAHRHGLQAIADIKLNDIGSTNQAAVGVLREMGFDAVIVNPIMGEDSLGRLISGAHGDGMGVIALCHMSAPEARPTYELSLGPGKGRSRLYELFLDWAISQGADGIVAGATFPEIIRRCREEAGRRLDIYSPGVGAQGGSASAAVAAGADYLIAGRTIIGSGNSVGAAKVLQSRVTGQHRTCLGQD